MTASDLRPICLSVVACTTQVAGYCHAPARTYQPPPPLQHFLETGPPPVYFGFGSMPVNKPEVSVPRETGLEDTQGSWQVVRGAPHICLAESEPF
jgi:hypothetical protein